MRLFIAILLDEAAKEYLSSVQDQFRESIVRGSYTPEENLHLTLAFIGEYPDSDKVMDALESVWDGPFEITFSGVGRFDDLWWIGIQDNEALSQLVKRVQHSLSEAGIPYDKKRFKPHITLLRRADFSKGRPEQIVTEARTMKVSGIFLMRSSQGKHGMIYSEMGYVSE